MKLMNRIAWMAALIGVAGVWMVEKGHAETIVPGDYENQAAIRFPDYAGTTILTNFPVLLELSDSKSVVSVDDFESDDYSDLRFTTADGSNTVPFDVEQWFFPPAASAVPTNLSGCVLWLKADDGVQTDPISGLVTNWIDRSGNGNDASQGEVWRQPTNVLAQLNGKPVVRFNGGGNGNTITNRLEFPSVTAQTVFIVNRVETGSQNLDGILGVPNDNGIRRNNASEWQYGSWVNDGSQFYVNGKETTAMGEDEYHLICVVRNGTSSASHLGHYFDHAVTGRSFDGEIAEVIIYNRGLTEIEVSSVNAYIKNKYALDIPHIPGTAWVWVQVPELTAATELYAYWGNTNATSIPGYATDGSTWDSDYVGVWHLGSTYEIGDLRDSTANMFDGTNAVSPHDTANTETIIGDGQQFDWNGSNHDYISLPDNAHNFSDVFSVSLWSYFWKFNGRKNVIGKDQDTTRFAFTMFSGSDRRLNFATKNGGQSSVLSANPVFNANQWHHIVATVQTGSLVRLYVDGLEVGTGTVGNRNDFGSLRLGRTPDTYWGGIEGLQDEARISTSVRSPDWIKASYDSQVSPGSFARVEQDAYWDTSSVGGLQDGPGTWDMSSPLWSEDTGGTNPQTWREGALARFVPSGGSDVAAGFVVAQGIVVDGTDYTFSGGTVSLGGSGLTANEDVSISANIGMHSDQAWHVASGKVATVTGKIVTPATLTKTGQGDLYLNNGNANKFLLDGMVIDEGRVRFNTGGWYKNPFGGTKTITINQGGTARIERAHGWGVEYHFFHINGGTLDLAKEQYMRTGSQMTGGEIMGTSEIRMWGGKTLIVNSAPTPAVISSRLNCAGSTPNNLQVADGSSDLDLLISGVIAGGGGIRLTSGGTVKFSGANTYGGQTIVNAGTLLVSNGSGSGIGSSVATVQAGGTLGGTGSVASAITVTDGGILAPGESTGNFTVSTGNVAFVSGGATNRFAVELGSAADYSSLTLDAGSITLSNVVLDVTLGYAPMETEKYFVIVNDGSDPVIGAFEGLPEDGSIVDLGSHGGTPYEGIVSYTGDAGSNRISGGNDVVISFSARGLLFMVR